MAKLAPSDLAQVLSRLPAQPTENVIVGFDTADDAGVFRLTDDLALVQTVDFFTPVSDDPFVYGQVAAVNSLNDVYAMGGRPISALSVVCYPQKGDWDVLAEILAGGQSAMNADKVVVIGGHSVDDQEMKFGYAVTGVINPRRVITNANAKPGDALILTKPIGTGAINTAVKNGKASPETIAAVTRAMTASAAYASEVMQELGANSCTDVTGFGLLGHAYEMARGSNVTLDIESASVPLLPDVLDLIAQGMLTRGDRNNRQYVGDAVRLASSVSGEMQSALYDPQTAGGLLISLPPEKVDEYLKRVDGAKVIGGVAEKREYLIDVF
ncbi:MAG TPA: selenide, water dikinase SelD [Pyrinomonadaceae bacterium]|nr:selenide, water dikinase SelD [Pyrinomonadaceae bacterium]